MLGLFAKVFVLCVAAFCTGAVLAWLRLRATIRGLRAAVRVQPRALTVGEVAADVPVDVDVDGEVVDDECVVKGSAKSMIFHTPSSPYFKRMKGDVTFRSPADAERAGYTRWTPKPKASTSAR